MITVTLCFQHHASRQTEVRAACDHVGSPITTSFTLPHHAAQQAEVRAVRDHVGSPVTAPVAFPHHAAGQAELRSTGDKMGSPVTATFAFPYHIACQSELCSTRVYVGSDVTASVAFPHHVPLQTELRSLYVHTGSPNTVTVKFPPYFPQQGMWCSIRSHVGSPKTVTVAFQKFPKQTAVLRWHSKQKAYTTSTIRFQNDYHRYTTASIRYSYDWKLTCTTALRYRHWSVVPAGWKIIARNLETNESFELGFIDTENPSLEDVFLSDGDYEISVLTSSFFWKDCLDRTVRTISVRPGEEVTPLPTIYNLRSAVLNGVTTIRWSANQSELGDCVFGVWYGSDSPVDTNRPPDSTIWYYASQTEYATIFYQNAPAYVAVAAMRTGDELGKLHELYLDWSNVPPHRPDDVLVLAAPLPVVDKTVEQHREDGEFWSMWGG